MKRLGLLLSIVLLAVFGVAGTALSPKDELAEGFAHPPAESKPWTFWWWLDSNVSREGITADLEAMKEQGIAGALIVDGGEGGTSPVGPPFMSPQWREMFRFAAAEADRLGMKLSFNICSGWNAGGPWVTPEHALKKVTWSEIGIKGPGSIDRLLPQPIVVGGYYRDQAVLACRVKRTQKVIAMQAAHFWATASSLVRPIWAHNAVVGSNPDSRNCWSSYPDKPGGPTRDQPEFLTLEFTAPFTAAGAFVNPHGECGPRDCELQTSDDGKTFRTVSRFVMAQGESKTVTFDETTAKSYRLLVTSPQRTADKPCANVQVSEFALLKKGETYEPWAQRGGVKNLRDKIGRFQWTPPGPGIFDEFPDSPGDVDLDSDSVIDLSNRMTSDGRLQWDAPEGDWVIFRFGYTLVGSMGDKTKCTSRGSEGYEIDFLSAESFRMHFARTAGQVIKDIGPLAGTTLQFLHTDSPEFANPDWTPRMREEFRKRRGYDPTPFLPVFAGRIVDSRDISNRFLWDLRRTMADLYADQFRLMRDLGRPYGIKVHAESGGPAWPDWDSMENLGTHDIPVGEYWVRNKESSSWSHEQSFYPWVEVMKQAGSAAHIYGKRLAMAEALTNMGRNWEEAPSMFKDITDRAFCKGLTRTMLCFYVHQPYLDIKPGYVWPKAGTHFDRNVTWFNQFHAFLTYLQRCQFILEKGLFVADFLYFYGQDSPGFMPDRPHTTPFPPLGYDYDMAGADVILNRTSVKNGRVVLPDGMSYPVLVLPVRQTMTPEVLEKIAALVEAGATVVGPKPLRSPSFKDYPKCDQVVKALADRVWGNCDGVQVKEHAYGKGRVIWGKSLEDILAKDGVERDFDCQELELGEEIDYIHRTLPDSEIYFVSNQTNSAAKADCSFRVSGRQPEIWDPLTAKRWDATNFRQKKGRTIVPLQFAARQSWFVVFRKAIASPAPGRPNFPAFVSLGELSGPWTVRFDPEWGGPKSIVFSELQDWTRRTEPGIKYYSGTATYEKTFDLPAAASGSGKPVFLDLGEVCYIARVRLNGKDLGVVWTAPWHVEITGVAKPLGNRLEIGITNMWPNRLIGDAGLPEKERRTKTNVIKFTKDSPLMQSGLLGPVTLRAAER